MAIGKRKANTGLKNGNKTDNKRSKPADSVELKVKSKKQAVASPEESPSESGSPISSDSEIDEDNNVAEESEGEGGDEFTGFEDEDELDNEEEDGEEKSEESKKKSKDAHANQKKLQKDRKASKPFADVSTKAKTLWDKLRQKGSIKADERKTLVSELFDMIKSNVKQIVFKHDMSRVIQTCVKYGSKQQREIIASELSGSFVELCKSPYGKYLAVKLFKYGTPKMKEGALGELYGHVTKLIRHREAAYVVEDIFREYTNLQQQTALICEFYGPEFQVFKERTQDMHIDKILQEHPEKRASVMNNLWKTIEGSIAKGSIGFTMVHRAMLEFIQHASSNEAKDLLLATKEQIYEFVHTRDGSQVAMKLFAIANAKDRKAMLKVLRPYFVETAKDSYGHLVLVTALDCTDDTIMTGKLLQAEFENELIKLSVHKFSRRVLLYVLVGWEDARYFSKENRTMLASLEPLKAATSKKDPAVRRNELKAAIGPMLLNVISNAAGELLAESLSSQVVVDTLLTVPGDKESAVNAVLRAFEGNPADETHLVHQIHCSRALKTLVQNGHWNGTEKRVVKSEEELGVAEGLKDVISEHLVEWATGDGAFVVLAVLETLDEKERKKFLDQLKKHQKTLKKSEFRGTQKLLEML
ncbi:pumilio family RNA-binding protein Puf6 [Schizosaccharomyces osmophilus]|uniref:Pumilio family RNA-binding protein Puf6 n=1 Tax=Schizosaccharomyces osmophilus TaxID=2545709 RepID=A0AAE9WEZ4_9SCHI|nr:pumilio family RNA-binding protein Puf6 [Schizosaccharomyces osmophilus]WBW75127.1 pumilio family RNA-binding protein Puf6 [Schizosaccharomyces osmophilus]